MVFPVKLQSLRRTAEKQKPDKHCSRQRVKQTDSRNHWWLIVSWIQFTMSSTFMLQRPSAVTITVTVLHLTRRHFIKIWIQVAILNLFLRLHFQRVTFATRFVFLIVKIFYLDFHVQKHIFKSALFSPQNQIKYYYM